MITERTLCKRSETRSEIIKPVFIRNGTGAISWSRNWAMSFNVSTSGLGLFTNMPIEPGHEFTISCRFLWPESVKATAVWCERISDNRDIFKAGFRLSG